VFQAASPSGGGAGGVGARRRISFTITVRIDKTREWDEMLDDAWCCTKYRFYDPKFHGTDWDAMRAKYKPLVAFVADRQKLLDLINEMIGSHTVVLCPADCVLSTRSSADLITLRAWRGICSIVREASHP
jgi:hypothetical protein